MESSRIIKIPKLPYLTDPRMLDRYVISSPSLSIDNEYIPLRALADGELFNLNQTLVKKITNEEVIREKKLVLYDFKVRTRYLIQVRNYVNFANNLLNDIHNYDDDGTMELVNSNIRRKYTSSSGSLVYLEEDRNGNSVAFLKATPLIMLAAKKEYLFKIDKNKPDINHFCVLVDRKLIDDEEHFKLYRNIKKSYLDLIERHIDILYTKDINKMCFNPSLKLGKVDTIEQMMGQLSNMNDVLVEAFTKPEPEVITPTPRPFQSYSEMRRRRLQEQEQRMLQEQQLPPNVTRINPLLELEDDLDPIPNPQPNLNTGGMVGGIATMTGGVLTATSITNGPIQHVAPGVTTRTITLDLNDVEALSEPDEDAYNEEEEFENDGFDDDDEEPDQPEADGLPVPIITGTAGELDGGNMAEFYRNEEQLFQEFDNLNRVITQEDMNRITGAANPNNLW